MDKTYLGGKKRTKGEYVRRDRHAAATAHVNTAESFNATLKRAWPDAERQSGIGVFHWFSIKHTSEIAKRFARDRYLHETSFRWNARTKDTDTRLADLFARSNRRRRSRSAGRNAEGRFEGRLRWKDLTA